MIAVKIQRILYFILKTSREYDKIDNRIFEYNSNSTILNKFTETLDKIGLKINLKNCHLKQKIKNNSDGDN